MRWAHEMIGAILFRTLNYFCVVLILLSGNLSACCVLDQRTDPTCRRHFCFGGFAMRPHSSGDGAAHPHGRSTCSGSPRGQLPGCRRRWQSPQGQLCTEAKEILRGKSRRRNIWVRGRNPNLTARFRAPPLGQSRETQRLAHQTYDFTS